MFKFLMKKFSKNTEEIEEVEEVKQDNKNEYEDYIDVVCQIMTEDNKLLFVGQIDDFDASTEQLKINPYRKEETPKGVSYDTPVKINMKYKGNIIIVHGEIAVQSNAYWRIKIGDKIEFREQRENFRQETHCKGNIIKRALPNRKIECDILNISISGIAFTSTYMFAINEQIIIQDIKLYEECERTYKFDCVVKRSFKAEDDKMCYGCEFKEISETDESNLCKDVLYLQAKSMKNN